MLPSDRTSNHRPSIESVMNDVQFTKSNHPTHKKLLTDIYKSSDSNKFIATFLDCLKVCLVHEEKSPNVELTLDFAAEFAVSFSLDMKEDDICPLLEGVFQFIFESHDCQIPLVRLRICQLMNRLLDNMGADASVVEETYNKIATSMLVRLKDSMSSVRTQAVYALHRLQSPGDPDCDIIAAFKYHMMHDPCHEVRRAVIQKIAVTKATVAAVITRLYDIKDTVRKQAYVFINRMNIRQFTIKQRQTILENGLGDRSDLVQDYVIGTIVHNWLKFFNFNFYEFLECIHVEKIPDIGIKLLKAFFEKQDDVVLESKIKEMWIINREIRYERLNITSVVFWRALAEYLKPTENSDKFDSIFEQVLPDLTPFCNYIRGYFFPVPSDKPEVSTTEEEILNCSEEDSTSKSQDATSQDSSSQATAEEAITNKAKKKESPKNKTEKKSGPDEAVLAHLLQMCKVFDYSDEMGRKALQKLCVEFLESPCIKEKATVAELAKLLDDVMPNNDAKLNLMAEIITELREPLQADNSEPDLDLLIQENDRKKTELNTKIKELGAELEIAEELNDNERIGEIKTLEEKLSKELKVLDKETPLELGRNVNNDPEILKKCLTIVVEVMRRGKITKMNSTLYSLVQNFVAPTIKLRIEGDRTAIKNLAFQALGIFCVLDSELAKENFVMFCVNIANEHLGVTCLKCVFDLLYVYDLATFEIDDPDSVTFKNNLDKDGQSKPNLILLLMSLLSSESSEMRKTAVIGLCKMLFAGKLKSPDLVSKLMLLWYDPAAEGDPYIRQPLGTFFSMFATTSPHAPFLFQQAFIPTIKHLFFIDVTDSLAEVDVLAVASLFFEFTKPNFNQHTKKDISIHNQIAISICEELLTENYESGNSIMFFKMLFMLELNCGIETDFNILNALALRITKTIVVDDRILYRYAIKFKNILNEQLESNKTVSTVDNTLPPETSLGSNVISRTSQLLESTRYRRESDDDEEVDDDLEELEEEEEAEDASQDMTLIERSLDDDLVIPGTPESSDSDSDVFKGFDHPVSKTSKVKHDELSSYVFKGFDLPVLKISKVKDVEFKRPLVPPAKTPAKRSTSSRTPKKTPSNTSAQDFKSDDKLAETRIARKTSPTKTPGKASTSKSAKTPVKTPSKVSVGTPPRTKSSKTPSKVSVSTPPRTKSSKTPGKRLSDSPSSPATRSSTTRLTRSGKKRKS